MTLHHPMQKYTGLQNVLAVARHAHAGVCVFMSDQFKGPCQARKKTQTIMTYNWCLNVFPKS